MTARRRPRRRPSLEKNGARPGGSGGRAEEAVCAHLAARGVTVLATNVRVSREELDIVARDGELILIVEVRTRGAGAYARAFASIGWRKRKHIVDAATVLWTTRLSKMPGVERVRFDVAGVTFDGDAAEVEYVKGAFTA